MSADLSKIVIDKMCLEIIYLIYIYLKDLALNNIQWLICLKIKPNQTISYKFNIYIKRGFGIK